MSCRRSLVHCTFQELILYTAKPLLYLILSLCIACMYRSQDKDNASALSALHALQRLSFYRFSVGAVSFYGAISPITYVMPYVKSFYSFSCYVPNLDTRTSSWFMTYKYRVQHRVLSSVQQKVKCLNLDRRASWWDLEKVSFSHAMACCSDV